MGFGAELSLLRSIIKPGLLRLQFFCCKLNVPILLSYARITGKLAGRVTDAETNGSRTDANVIIEGTTLGAMADKIV